MRSIRYSCRILMKLEFSQQFSKNAQISNFMKIRPVVAGLLHKGGRAGGQTDRQT